MGVWDLTRPCQTTGDCVSLCHLVGTFFLLIPGKTGSVAGDTIIHQTHQTASQFSWNLWTTREHKCAVRHHSCLAMGVLQPLPSVPPQLACLSHPPARMWTSRLTALSGPQGLSWKPGLSATPGSAPSLCPLHPSSALRASEGLPTPLGTEPDQFYSPHSSTSELQGRRELWLLPGSHVVRSCRTTSQVGGANTKWLSAPSPHLPRRLTN